MNTIAGAISVGLLLLTQAAAAPGKFGKQCVQLDVPVPVSANNSHYQSPKVDNNIDATDWFWETSTWSHPNSSLRIDGSIPVHSTFTIRAQLCVPSDGKKSDILQIASHGIGFDKR